MFEIIKQLIINYLKNELEKPIYDISFKKKASADIESAINDLMSLFNDIEGLYSQNKNEIEEVLVKSINNLYHSDMYSVSSHIKHINSFFFIKQLLLIFYTNMSVEDFNLFLKKKTKAIRKFFNKHPEMYLLFDIALNKLFNPQAINPFEAKEMSDYRLVEIKNIPENLCLYHGTTYENYLKIIDSGYIMPSEYKAIDGFTESQKSFYAQKDGFVFLASGLDIPIDYAHGNYRENIFKSRESNGEIVYKDILTFLNDKGIIFAVNPKNYNLFLDTVTSEFLINSKISLKDTKAYLVERNNGIVTIKDMEGNKVNDLCYV